MSDTWLFIIGTVLLCVGALPANLYVVLYAKRSPWADSTIGRDAMLLACVLALVLDQAIAVNVFGLDGWARAILRVAVYLVISYALWRKLWVLNRVQKDPVGVRQADIARAAKRHNRKLQDPNAD